MMAWTEYPAFRAYLVRLMADQMAALMTLVEAVAFHRLDQRPARALLGRGRLFHTTHQRIAEELRTARSTVAGSLSKTVSSFVRLGGARGAAPSAQE